MQALDMEEVSTSPFAGAALAVGEPEGLVGPAGRAWAGAASPFAEGLTEADESDVHQAQWAALVDELSDESFDDAVEALVDAVAGHHLKSMATWASHDEASALASREASEWLGEVAASTDRALAQLEQAYADRSPAGVSLEELEAYLSPSPGSTDPVTAASEQLFGGLVKKAFDAAKGIAKAGIAAVGKFLPMGKLFGLLRKLVRPLLRRVLAKALGRLPQSVRPVATQLAHRFGVAEAEETIASEFDAEFAELLLSPTDMAAEQLLAESEAAASVDVLHEDDALARLDAARTRLARELAEADPGKPPTEQLEQFIPAVMAALPLVRTGINIVGRERVRNFLATALATLIQGHVGPVAARALAPHIADTGLRLLRLEAESSEALGAEALVDALEDTFATVGQLPLSALEDPLRLEMETAEAFADAAARLLPPEVLRPDLETLEDEEDGKGEAWVLMPRGGGRRRYRKLARVFDIAISRPRARTIVYGEDTLEDRLLEAGVERWPVHAETHVYETILGTQLGHLAAFEGDGAPALAEEFEELTPQAAAVLLGRPGLGRRFPTGVVPFAPGRRLVRLVVPGRVVRRRRSRIVLRLDSSAAQPVLRLHLRLGERPAHLLAEHLSRQALPDALGVIRTLVGPTVQQSVATGLVRHLARATGSRVPALRGQQLGAHLIEAMLSALSQQLPSKAAELETAAKDAKPGLTLTFAFRFADKAALSNGQPEAPGLTIRPGWHRD
jgi:hypothetical protein